MRIRHGDMGLNDLHPLFVDNRITRLCGRLFFNVGRAASDPNFTGNGASWWCSRVCLLVVALIVAIERIIFVDQAQLTDTSKCCVIAWQSP